MRILLVEDDGEMASWLARALGQSGFVADHAADAFQAQQLLQSDAGYDAVVLDLGLGLPDRDGLSLLTGLRKGLRKGGLRTPVLVLTARGALPDKVQSLKLGADDFLAKPFEIEELEARLAALVRRSRQLTESQLRCGSHVYDLDSRSFTRNDALVALTPREHAAPPGAGAQGRCSGSEAATAPQAVPGRQHARP